MRDVRRAVRPFPKAALFELTEDGFASPSSDSSLASSRVRTRDEVTLPTARKLFSRAHTPLAVSKLTPQEIDELISACSYHECKAHQIHHIARRAVDEFEGELPCDYGALLSCGGVGHKCAILVLGISCNEPR